MARWSPVIYSWLAVLASACAAATPPADPPIWAASHSSAPAVSPAPSAAAPPSESASAPSPAQSAGSSPSASASVPGNPSSGARNDADACRAGNGGACERLGNRLGNAGDAAGSCDAFKRGCDARPAVQAACASYALCLGQGDGVPKDLQRALDLSEIVCFKNHASGCLVHGVLAHQSANDARAQRDFHRACALGDSRGCAFERKLASQASAPVATQSLVPGANFTAASMEIEGLHITSLSCKLGPGGAGLFGGLVVAKTLSERKAAMDRCTKKPANVTVTWTSTRIGKRATHIRVHAENHKLAACVRRALRGAPATVPAQCGATVHLP